jgi:hypothetical protein
VFDGLDRCEAILSRQRYIAGDELTEADVRLFATLIRFDEVRRPEGWGGEEGGRCCVGAGIGCGRAQLALFCVSNDQGAFLG